MNIEAAEKEIRALARRLGVKPYQVRVAIEAIEDIPAAKAPTLGRPAHMATAADLDCTAAFDKFTYVRSLRLCEAFRLIPCQHCGADDGTVCGAHSNWAVHGKGRGLKASDIYQASLCYTCHSMLDQGSRLLERERKTMWWNAHTKSVPLLINLGHWPKDIEPPNVSDWPF